MSGSVNKVILVGNLGKDPEIRHLENGAAVANFSIATSENYKDRKTGEKVSQTEWHNIVAWRGLAEIAEKYLKKGHKVYIEGKLKTRTWQDQDGNNRYSTEVITDNLTMLGNANQNENKSNYTEPSNKLNTDKKPAEKEFSAPGDEDDLPF
ncbi:MAG: single-stranded DNA-binding protein [Flavobacteriales bacterium]|jgi:single-strand DNA-binding protein|nr:single-stranded DNA-binding protein [Flavobacteriales bacterium]MDG1439541.1 single-stranded DNA-binding protein [Flavobacteriales bacterium]MDG1797077.1 single-stranded DNA-binding protein [Flavobacteriales bacterium]|tara:strand:- start:966 stop:1418 length:453 start_codon:yes stop_codon:yes gene_type:complete